MKAPLVALLATLLATAGPSAHADTATDSYLATKAKAIADLARPVGAPITPALDALEDAAILQLDRLVRAVVGPIRVDGFPPDGTSHVVSLSDGTSESGHIDGLHAESPDGTTLLLTTVPLVQAWLTINAAAIATPGQPANDTVAAALRDERFYTQAFSSDAAVTIYAEIPVATAAEGLSVRAFVFRRSQDRVAPWPPDRLIVSVIRGDRITLFDKPIIPATLDIPACKAAWTAAGVGVQRMFAGSSRTAGATSTVEQAQAAADKAEHAFVTCYRENLPTLPAMPAVTRQAADLVDRTH